MSESRSRDLSAGHSRCEFVFRDPQRVLWVQPAEKIDRSRNNACPSGLMARAEAISDGRPYGDLMPSFSASLRFVLMVMLTV